MAEAPTNDELRWSVELPFERQRIQRDVPHRAGVYQIMQSEEYPRYREATRVLKIGNADKNLGDELQNHFQRHIAANRLTRIRNRFDISVTVVLVETSSEVASTCEQQLLRSFEDRSPLPAGPSKAAVGVLGSALVGARLFRVHQRQCDRRGNCAIYIKIQGAEPEDDDGFRVSE